MTGAERIAAERERQIEKEGWDAIHDDVEHRQGGLVRAAICYAINKARWLTRCPSVRVPRWPWPGWDKRKKHSRIRSLEIAGALLAAEIDRLQAADSGRN